MKVFDSQGRLKTIAAAASVEPTSAQFNALSNTVSGLGGGAGSVTSADFVSLRSAVTANSAQMTSADNAVSAAVAALSGQHTSLAASVAGALSAIAVNSAQMVSADNAISNALSVEISNRQSADAALSLKDDVLLGAFNGLSARVDSVAAIASGAASAVVVNSAQMTSADNAISGAAAAVSGRVDSVNQRISTLVLDSIANVSAPSPSDQQVLLWNSAAAQWLASSLAPGTGSVTSTEVSAVSAAAASADATLSVRIDSAMTVVSNQGSAIVANSAQMTSADNAISAAAAAVSANATSIAGRLDAVSGSLTSVASIASAAASAVNALSVVVSNHTSAIAANSAQMTSADNAISGAVVALSAQHTSLAASVAGALSAIAANSAQMTSADSALGQRISTLILDSIADVSISTPATSGQTLLWNATSTKWYAATPTAGSGSVTSTELSVVDARVTSVMSAVSVESAARAAADTSLDGRATSIMSAVSVESASRAAADISIMSAISVESAARAAADTSLDGRATSIMSAVSVESAARAAADISIMSAVSVESAARAAADTSINQRISTLVLDSIQNVSAPSPTTGQALVFNSVAGQWVASTPPGGSGSVTSTELSVVDARVTSVMSAVSVNSAQMTSADDAISAVAADALSAARAASANITSVLSNQISAISVAHVSLVSDVGRISDAVAAGLVSAGPVKRVLADSQLVTATAPVSLSGFTFTVSSNVAYGFEFGIFHHSPTSLAGIKFVLSAPNNELVAHYINGASPAAVAQSVVNGSNQTVAYVTVSAAAQNKATYIRGTIRAVPGGTVALAVGNNVSTTTITINAGSYGYLWRMA